jgi:WD40 repeat protein/serine/threonine protein kinase
MRMSDKRLGESLDKIVDRFEDAWQSGYQPVVEQYLPSDVESSFPVLVELVHVDLERRLAAGMQARTEDYLERFGALGRDTTAVEELLLAEVRLRRLQGEMVSFDEIRSRFPHLATRLLEHFEPANEQDDTASPASQQSAHSPAAVAEPLTDAEADSKPSIAGYSIDSILGEGGAAIVYLAWQHSTRRRVAIKMLHADRAHAKNLSRRLIAEAEAIARLQHPNIVQVIEADEYRGRPFFVMEYLEKGSLHDRLADRPLGSRESAELVRTLARATQAAHDRGIIHRDLKPSNVLFSAAGTPKIADFGLAKQLHADEFVTQTGDILGTPSFMSPEQAGAAHGEAGVATDVYSLGAILYAALTGSPPFKAASIVETLDQVRNADPLYPSALVPKLPADLETICLKCLEKQPRRRYPTAASLADELERFLNNQPILARPVGNLERGIRWCQRNRAVAALASLVLLTFLVGALASTLFAIQASFRARDAEAATIHAVEAQREAETQQRLAKRSQYFTLINVAQQAWDSGNVARCLEILNDLQAPGSDPEPLGFEFHRLLNLCHQNIRTLAGHAKAVMSIDQSADGSRLLSGGFDGRLLLWSLDDPTGYREIAHSLDAAPRSGQDKTVHGVRAVAISPDGKTGASTTYNEIQIWNLDSGQRLHTIAKQPGDCFGMAFTPDGTQLGVLASQGIAHCWDPVSGKETSQFAIGRFVGNIGAMAFTPDGSLLAVAAGLPVGEGQLRFWDYQRQSEPRAPLRGHKAVILAMAFSKDGKRMATGSADQTIKIWDLAENRVLCTLVGHEGFVTSVRLSDDGRQCFSAGADHTVRVWDVDAERLRTTLRGHQDLVTSILISPTDHKIISASGDATIRIWPEDLRSYQTVPFVADRSARGKASFLVSALASDSGPPFLLTSLSLSVDQTHLAAVVVGPDGNGRVEVRNIDDPGDAYPLIDPERPNQSYACGTLSPDGKLFAAGTGSYLNTFVMAARRGHALPKNSNVVVWSVAAGGHVMHRLAGHKHEIFSMAFSPSGEFLATCDTAGEISLWELAKQTRRVLFAGDREPGIDVRFSRDGRYLAAASSYSDRVRVWNLESNEMIEIPTEFPTSVAFSPDPAFLAIGSGSLLADRSTAHGEVTVWDWRRGQPLKTLAGHSQFVRRVFYAPDGLQLWSVGFDGSARLWDVATGGEIAKVDGLFRYALSADLSVTGDRLAIGTEGGEACLWDGRAHNAPVQGTGEPRLPK